MTPHLTTAHRVDDERDASIHWLRLKIVGGRAGLDAHDSSVMIVEVDSPEKAWRLDLIGHMLTSHPWVRPDRSTCIRVRAIIEADARVALRLDEPGAPTLGDVPLGSLSAHPDARAEIIEMDRSRHAGRSYR